MNKKVSIRKGFKGMRKENKPIRNKFKDSLRRQLLKQTIKTHRKTVFRMKLAFTFATVIICVLGYTGFVSASPGAYEEAPEVVKSTIQALDLVETGTISIKTNIPNAHIFVNGMKVGEGEAYEDGLWVKEHEVYVTANGHTSYQENIAVTKGHVNELNIELEPVIVVAPKPITENHDFTDENQEEDDAETDKEDAEEIEEITIEPVAPPVPLQEEQELLFSYTDDENKVYSLDQEGNIAEKFKIYGADDWTITEDGTIYAISNNTIWQITSTGEPSLILELEETVTAKQIIGISPQRQEAVLATDGKLSKLNIETGEVEILTETDTGNAGTTAVSSSGRYIIIALDKGLTGIDLENNKVFEFESEEYIEIESTDQIRTIEIITDETVDIANIKDDNKQNFFIVDQGQPNYDYQEFNLTE